MGQPNADTIQVDEGKHSFTGKQVDSVLKNIDERVNSANVWHTATRSAGLLTKIEYFLDAGKTQKFLERQYGRLTGVSGIRFVSSITTIIYNSNGSEDSRVVQTYSRETNLNKNVLVNSNSVFTTSEPEIGNT